MILKIIERRYVNPMFDLVREGVYGWWMMHNKVLDKYDNVPEQDLEWGKKICNHEYDLESKKVNKILLEDE